MAFVRERWPAGESFSDDLVVLRGAAEHWSRDIAGARIHGTIAGAARGLRARRARSLAAGSGSTVRRPRWTAPKVHPDHHVQVAQALYPPTTYIGRSCVLEPTRRPCGSTSREASSSAISASPGKRSTDFSDYPGAQAYASRKSSSPPFGEHAVSVSTSACTRSASWDPPRG